LSQSEVRRGLAAVQSDLAETKIDDVSYWMPHSCAKADLRSSAHLLPAFDEYIISYRDRTAVLPTEHHAKAVSDNGVFRPAIEMQGQIIGLWKKTTTKTPTVQLNCFVPQDAAAQTQLTRAEAQFKTFAEKT
jgi:hypothetical protein